MLGKLWYKVLVIKLDIFSYIPRGYAGSAC